MAAMPDQWPITELGEYVLNGPLTIWPSTSRSHLGLVKHFSLNELILGSDPERRMAVYVPDLPAGRPPPVRLQPVVRLALWNRYSDVGRKRSEQLTTVDATVGFYRLAPNDLPSIDAALRGLDSALTHLQFQSQGLDYPPPWAKKRPEIETPSDEADDHPFVIRYRTVQRFVYGANWEITYFGLQFPELNLAWEKLAKLLLSHCIPGREINCEERYSGLSPEEYAGALRRKQWSYPTAVPS